MKQKKKKKKNSFNFHQVQQFSWQYVTENNKIFEEKNKQPLSK